MEGRNKGLTNTDRDSNRVNLQLTRLSVDIYRGEGRDTREEIGSLLTTEPFLSCSGTVLFSRQPR